MASKGGYHHFEVIEGDSKILECVYCHGLLKDAKELLCGHLICKICLNEQKSELCCPLPSCQESFQISQVHSSKYANRLVSNLKVSCLKKEFGCEWKGSIAEYFKTHEGVCDKSEEKKILEDVLKEMKQANLKINKLSEENKTNKIEREKLNRVIEELKQANENQFERLTKEIEEQKQAKEENQNTVENLIREVDELKQEIHEYKKKYENKKEDKHNITNQPPVPAFRLNEQFMVSGLEKFIENTNRDIPCISYEEWFREIFDKLQENKLCVYENYLFLKVKFEEKHKQIYWDTNKESNNTGKWKVSHSGNRVDTYMYNENWNYRHIKYSVLLHPKEVNKVLELQHVSCVDDYDRFEAAPKITEDYYSVKNELILCCKKR